MPVQSFIHIAQPLLRYLQSSVAPSILSRHSACSILCIHAARRLPISWHTMLLRWRPLHIASAAAQQYLRYSRSGYSRLYNTTHAGGCTALSLPSISFSLAHIGLALLQILPLTKDEEVLIVERRDDEELRHFVRSHDLEKMGSPSSA